MLTQTRSQPPCRGALRRRDAAITVQPVSGTGRFVSLADSLLEISGKLPAAVDKLPAALGNLPAASRQPALETELE